MAAGTSIQELFVTLGMQVKSGEWANAFALVNQVEQRLTQVFHAIEMVAEKAFSTVHDVAMQGDEIGGMAEKLGVTSDALQELQYAALLSDTSTESLTAGLRHLARVAHEAAGGSAEAIKALDGVKLKDAAGNMRPLNVLFTEMSDKIAELPPGFEASAKAQALFGRGGTDLVAMLKKGSAGINALGQEAHSMGAVMSGDALAAASGYDDAFKRLNVTMGGLQKRFANTDIIKQMTLLFDKLRTSLGTAGVTRVIDGLSRAFGWFIGLLGNGVDLLTEFVNSQGPLALGMVAATAGVLLLGEALVATGIAGVGAALSAGAAWLLAFVPVLLIGAAAFLIWDDVLTYIEGGESVLGTFIEMLGDIAPDDSPLMILFKRVGALIFDITSPMKWRALWDSFQMLNSVMLATVAGIISGLVHGIDEVIIQSVSRMTEVLHGMLDGIPGMSTIIDIGSASALSKFQGFASGRDNLVAGAPGAINSAGAYLADAQGYGKAGQTPGITMADLGFNGGAMSPTASTAGLNAGGISVVAPVTINASTNTSAEEIGAAVSSHMNTQLQVASAAGT